MSVARFLMRPARRHPLIFAGLFVIVGGLLFVSAVNPKDTAAASCPGYGTEQHCGFFKNNQQLFGGDFVFPGGIPSNVTDANSFISFIRGDYTSGNAQLKTGASFIILTMMGQPPTASIGSFTATYSSNSLADQWAQLIQQYDTQNLVKWNTPISWPGANCPNTYYQTTYDDVADFSYCDYNGVPGIEFFSPTNPGQVLYTIKISCGNPVGDLQPLQTPDPAPIGNVDNWSCTVVNGWALDKSKPLQAIFVDIYVDGGFWKRITANVSRPDVGSAYPGTGSNHGFSVGWDTTKFSPTGSHTIKVYAIGIDKNGALNNVNPLLSPGTITLSPCGSPPPPPPTSCPEQPGVNPAAVPAGFGAGNNGQITGDTSPTPGATYQIRSATAYHIVSARDTDTGQSLPVNTANNTVDFSNSEQTYPYDSHHAQVTYYDTYNITQFTYKVDSNGVGSWVVTASASGWSSGQFSDGNATLGECYWRSFYVQNPSQTDITSVSLSPDNEDPTTASFGGNVTVQFKLEDAGVHSLLRPMQVQLNTQIFYYRQTASGLKLPLGSQPQSLTVGSTMVPNTLAGFIGTSIPISVPPMQPGDRICFQFTANPQGTRMDENGAVKVNNGVTVTSSYQCSAPIVNEPYVKVYGNDVWAGGGFADASGNCSTQPGIIDTYVKAGGAQPRGSSTQYAAMALGVINQFASAGLRTSTPTGPSGLSFANTTGGYGGNSGLAPYCLPDYASQKSAGTGALPTTNWAGLVPNGSYEANGSITLTVSPGTHLNPGQKTALFVNGDVYIKPVGFGAAHGSISFGNTWASLQQVPSLYIVANNIYLDPNIDQLDGVYVAEPTSGGAGGLISTCATSAGPITGASAYDTCDNQLTVTGSFIAKKVELDRTYASLRNSLAGEWPQVPATSATCDLNGDATAPFGFRRTSNNYVCAAEIFNFNPAIYLGEPALQTAPPKFDYITSLPPIL